MDERVDRTEARVEPAPLSRETRVIRPPRLRRLVILIVLVVAGLGVGWYWRVHRAPQPAGRGATAQAAPQPVGVATIDEGDVRIVLNELGTVTPLATVTVKTQINGQLVDVGFKEGQVVKKGDFLAQIDPRPFQVTLEQAQGQLAHDQGLLQQAQTNLKRFQTLGRQDSIAQQQVDDQRYLVAQDIGTVQSDQAQVDSANLNLTYCHIVSPIEGQIGLRQVDAGNYVQTSDPNGVVVITQMQPISVIFSVPEDNLPDIIQRLHTGATLSVEAYDRANVRKLANGQLGTLDNQIDTTTGTLKLRAMFDNPDELLYPNQFVNARLLVNTMQETVRVPVPAVQRGEPGTFVYVINADNTVSVRPVKLGPTDGGYAAVLSGLQPGDRVVTDGTDRLRDGAAVTVPAPGQASGRGQGRAGQAASPDKPAQPGQTPSEPGQRPDGQRGQRRSTPPQ
jgi:membrane fusion protein, multidrug efflux system